MRSVLKLLGKCAAVMAPVLVLMCFFSRHTISFIDGEGPYYLWNRETVNGTQERYYDTVILGDSVANAAFMPEILSEGVINLSLGGTTPMENYYTMLNWLDRHDAPRCCYISFQDFHFAREDCFWSRTMYSHRYGLARDLQMIKAAAAYAEPSVLSELYMLDFLSYELWLPNKYITAFLNASFNQRSQSNGAGWDSIELHGGRYIAKSVKEYATGEDQVFKAFTVEPLFDAYYRKLIELCLENGVQVRLVRLPMPDNCVFTDAYTQMFSGYYDALLAEYPDVTFDRFPLYEKSCFTDGHHMNIYGALRFSTELKKLYPQDFGDAEMSARQALGIDEYISLENDMGHILDWIGGRDYTAIIYDGQGGLERSVASLDGAEGMARPTLRRADVKQTPNGGSVYYAVGMDSGEADLTVCAAEKGLTVRMGEGEARAWDKASGNVIAMIVVDNYNGRVVCEKTFRYTQSDLVPAA